LATTYKEVSPEIRDEAIFPRLPGNAFSQQPDRIFACAGKGVNGAIVELRYGLEAKLALSVEYPAHILEAWAFSPTYESPESADESLFLLSLGDRSAVLRLSADAKDISDDENNTMFELRYRTVTAGICQGYMTQVTEQSIVTIDAKR
jgi:hypothetical protein